LPSCRSWPSLPGAHLVLSRFLRHRPLAVATCANS
jgi:hypothetical protein